MQEKKLWNIFHQYQTYGGRFDCDLVGTVFATKEEVDAYCAKWSKEKIAKDGMIYGIVFALEAEPDSNLETLVPYYDDFADDYQHMD